MGFMDMPPKVGEAIANIAGPGTEIVFQQYWGVLMLLCNVGGIIIMWSAIRGFYKKHKYRNPQAAEGKGIMFIGGYLMVQMNWVVMAILWMFGLT